jgi:glycosyltransferase involved in cell wall biosynthesis
MISVSVLICTYNRARRLAETLTCVSRLRPPHHTRLDVIVVDNNSSDDTQRVIEESARAAAFPVHYAFEARQGKSFALNTGLALARGDVLALTDDDVTPAEDWIEQIVDIFDDRSVVFAGGKVLPRWLAPPPPHLTTLRARDIWGPLALLDYGDERFEYTPEATAQRRPIGANMALRRDAMMRIGGWRTDMGKVNNTLISGEDHEIFFRLRRADSYRGVYEPRMIVHHDVPRARLKRRYFWRWFFASGQTRALMVEHLYPEIDFSRVPLVAGIPRFMFRQLAGETLEWVTHCATSTTDDALVREMQAVRLAGLMWQQAVRRRAHEPCT